MLEFLAAYWPILLIIGAFLTVIIILACKGKKQLVYKILYKLVTEAEEQFGAKTGPIKFADVMAKLYALLPAFIRNFVSYSTMSKWIEEALAYAKEEWKRKSEIPDEE